jgi:hypothetical protein
VPTETSTAQQFVHGDALKADLKRLDEHYLQLPKEVLEQGLYTFAQFSLTTAPTSPRAYGTPTSLSGSP